MRIILQEDVERLGNRGQIVNVATGYARNFLIPHKLAIEVSPGNLKALERVKSALARKEATEKGAAENLAGQLATVTLRFTRKAGEHDQLFGSVTSADIAEALEAQGFSVDKRRIALDLPIKIAGEYDVRAKLHRDVSAAIKVIITPESA